MSEPFTFTQSSDERASFHEGVTTILNFLKYTPEEEALAWIKSTIQENAKTGAPDYPGFVYLFSDIDIPKLGKLEVNVAPMYNKEDGPTISIGARIYDFIGRAEARYKIAQNAGNLAEHLTGLGYTTEVGEDDKRKTQIRIAKGEFKFNFLIGYRDRAEMGEQFEYASEVGDLVSDQMLFTSDSFEYTDPDKLDDDIFWTLSVLKDLINGINSTLELNQE